MIAQIKELAEKNRCLKNQPGKPQQHASIERYNRTVRGEWLGQKIFNSKKEAQEQATR